MHMSENTPSTRHFDAILANSLGTFDIKATFASYESWRFVLKHEKVGGQNCRGELARMAYWWRRWDARGDMHEDINFKGADRELDFWLISILWLERLTGQRSEGCGFDSRLGLRVANSLLYVIPWLPLFLLFSLGDLISNFPQRGKISNFPSLTCMSKHQIPKRIRNNANHISSSIMVLQTNSMTCREISD